MPHLVRKKNSTKNKDHTDRILEQLNRIKKTTMKTDNITDIIKTMRRYRRNEEISTYGKSISTPVIYKNKKKIQ